jgi:hypothetical protein
MLYKMRCRAPHIDSGNRPLTEGYLSATILAFVDGLDSTGTPEAKALVLYDGEREIRQTPYYKLQDVEIVE